MNKINLFLICGFFIAAFLPKTKAFAQPSFNQNGSAGIYFCISQDNQYDCDKCNSIPSGDAGNYYWYWLHLQNLIGGTVGNGTYNIISKVEIVINEVDPGGTYDEYIGACAPCKNWGHFYKNGYPRSWLISDYDSYESTTYGMGSSGIDTPCACHEIHANEYYSTLDNLYHSSTHTLTFTPPSGNGSQLCPTCTPCGPCSIDYRIYPQDHWMVSLVQKTNKLTLKVHIVDNGGTEASWSPITLQHLDQYVQATACPDCVLCNAGNSTVCP